MLPSLAEKGPPKQCEMSVRQAVDLWSVGACCSLLSWVKRSVAPRCMSRSCSPPSAPGRARSVRARPRSTSRLQQAWQRGATAPTRFLPGGIAVDFGAVSSTSKTRVGSESCLCHATSRQHRRTYSARSRRRSRCESVSAPIGSSCPRHIRTGGPLISSQRITTAASSAPKSAVTTKASSIGWQPASHAESRMHTTPRDPLGSRGRPLSLTTKAMRPV